MCWLNVDDFSTCYALRILHSLALVIFVCLFSKIIATFIPICVMFLNTPCFSPPPPAIRQVQPPAAADVLYKKLDDYRGGSGNASSGSGGGPGGKTVGGMRTATSQQETYDAL
jgi:hypothetical protein